MGSEVSWWMECWRNNPGERVRPIEDNLASLSTESSEVLGSCWISLSLWKGAVSGRVLARNRWNAQAEVWARLREPAKMGMGPRTSNSGEPSAPLSVGR